MIFSLIGYYALFASALSVNKIILFSLSTWFFVALRRLTAGLLLFSYALISSKAERLRFCNIRSDIGSLLYISILTMFIPSILKAYSFQNLVSSKAALLGSLDPFITALYAYLLWGENLTRNKIIGMCIASIGVIVLAVSTSPTEVVAGQWWIISLPELAMIGSLVISRYGWIKAREILKTDRYTSSELNSMIMIISGLYALIMAYILGLCDFCTIPLTEKFLGLFAYSVLFGEIIGYTIYGNLLKNYNIILLSLSGLLIPLFVYLYGPFLLGEPLSWYFPVSFMFVLSGMYLFYLNEI